MESDGGFNFEEEEVDKPVSTQEPTSKEEPSATEGFASVEENDDTAVKGLNFTLTDYQIEPVSQVIDNFISSKAVPKWISADRGWGKTFAGVYIAAFLYQHFGIRPLVICPPGEVRKTWEDMLTAAGVPAFGFVSWQSLSGQKGRKLSHPWLVRDQAEFHATVEFGDALDGGGMLLIADEFAAVKNETAARHWALVELISAGISHETGTFRCLLLSALFLAEEKNYECLFRVLGATNCKNEMMKQNPKITINEWATLGFGEVVKLAKKHNKKLTYQILEQSAKEIRPIAPGVREDYKYRFNKATMNKCLRLLWEQILVHLYQPVTVDIDYKDENGQLYRFDKRNGFFELPEEEAEQCQAAITALKRANIIDDDRVNIDQARRSIELIQAALLKLAHAKTPEFLRQIVKTLKANPTCKVIAIHPFLEDQAWLIQNLKMYGAVGVNGKIKFGDRSTNIALFNEPNLRCRVIVITPEAGGIGLSLHDRYEPGPEDFAGLKHLFKRPEDVKFPRKMWAISNFNYMAMFQAYGRAYRSFMRSHVELTVFYASNVSVESVLVNAMMKSKVAKGSIISKKREYPNEFQIYIDKETEDHAFLREYLERMQKVPLEEFQEARKTE